MDRWQEPATTGLSPSINSKRTLDVRARDALKVVIEVVKRVTDRAPVLFAFFALVCKAGGSTEVKSAASPTSYEHAGTCLPAIPPHFPIFSS